MTKKQERTLLINLVGCIMENKDKLKELYQLKRELLYHLVGMSYNMQKVLEIEKEIKKLERKK